MGHPCAPHVLAHGTCDSPTDSTRGLGASSSPTVSRSLATSTRCWRMASALIISEAGTQHNIRGLASKLGSFTAAVMTSEVPVRGARGGSQQHAVSAWPGHSSDKHSGYSGGPSRDHAPTPRDIHERVTLQRVVALAQQLAARIDVHR